MSAWRVRGAVESPPRQHVDRVTGFGNRGHLEPALRPDEPDRVARMAAADELVGERERRIHVTTGAATGDEREGRAHRATDVGRICRPMLASTPAENIVVTSAVPPNDTNGSGMPGDREQPDDRADVDHGLPDDAHRDPGGEQRAEAVGGAQRHPDPEDREADEERDHEQPADQPELLADDREDEVGVRVREEVPLRPARAEADAGEPAAADRDERLRDLVSGVGLVGERMQEGEQARPPVRLGDGEDGDDRGGTERHRPEMPRAAARGDEHGRDDEHEHQRGAEVGLAHHEEAERAEHDEDGLDDASPVADLARPAAGEIGGVERAARTSPARSAGSGTCPRRATAATRRRTRRYPG